jgi:hypothetical protein
MLNRVVEFQTIEEYSSNTHIQRNLDVKSIEVHEKYIKSYRTLRYR